MLLVVAMTAMMASMVILYWNEITLTPKVPKAMIMLFMVCAVDSLGGFNGYVGAKHDLS